MNTNKSREQYYNDIFGANHNRGAVNTKESPTKNDTEYLNNRTIYDDDFVDYNDTYTNERKKTNEEPPKKKKFNFKRFFFKLLAFVLAVILVVFAISWVMSLFLPQKTNFLIMATDKEGTRTDTLMLGSFDKSLKKITIVSIPRDTYVTVSDENYAKMNEEYPQPGSKSMKINAVHHYGGKKYGVAMVKDEVERLTGININFYVKVDFEAFRYIIDSVGGIEFYVPQNMSYSDPYQDLYIDLKEGMQKLNGEQAEHLLRYRSGYADADLGRIKVQQNFIKAFISQTFSKGTILTNPGVFLNAVFKYNFVETDAGFFDVAAYALLLGGIDSDKMETCTLPGTAGMAGGQSVYRPNVSEIVNLVSKITGD